MPLNTEDIISRFTEKHGSQYDYSAVVYTNIINKVKIGCKEHGEFLQSPKTHLRGSGCSQCSKEKQKKTLFQFLEKANETHNFRYDYSKVVYENARLKVSIICPVHGVFEQRATDHLSGAGCNQCVVDNCKVDLKDLINRFLSVHGDKYNYSKMKYVNIFTPIIIKCKKHGNFKQAPADHQRGKGCSKCISSKGENKIRLFLSSMKIDFVEQYKVCKNPKTNRDLKADFFIPDYNLVIEYDGEQHFKQVKTFGGSSALDSTQFRDSIKNEYCKENKINICRIPYYLHDRIENIILNYLKSIKNMKQEIKN